MERIGNQSNCYSTYSNIVELHFIAERLWDVETDPLNLEELYEASYIEALKEEYSLVGEMLGGLSGNGSMLEFLADSHAFESIEDLEAYVTSLPHDQFLKSFYGKGIKQTEITKALKDQSGIYELYKKYSKHIKSYTAFYMTFTQVEPFIKEYFELLKKLNTSAFQEFYKCLHLEGQVLLGDIEKALLIQEDPLLASENLMGKTFGNRGPYTQFIFVPSYFMPYRALRMNVYKDQILILNTRKKNYTSQDATKVMKLLADETRFVILELLSAGPPMMGRELAAKLNLSTATISHHMEQLRLCGLITEERIKNSKYYSVSTHNIAYFIDYMKTQFHITE